MGVFTNKSRDGSFLNQVVHEKGLIGGVEVSDLVEKVTMTHHEVPHSHLRLILGFDDIAILSNRRKTHGKRLANCPDFFYRDLDFFSNLLIGDVWVSCGVFADLKI